MKKLYIFSGIMLCAFAAITMAQNTRRVVLADGTAASVITTNGQFIMTNTTGRANVILGLARIATNNVETSVTNATTGVIVTSQSQSNKLCMPVLTASATVGFLAKFKLVSDGTTNVNFVFDKSYDGTNWEAVNIILNIAGSGATNVSGWTNFTINDFQYVRLRDCTNGNAAALTNLFAAFFDK
jgi:hypothetical protein